MRAKSCTGARMTTLARSAPWSAFEGSTILQSCTLEYTSTFKEGFGFKCETFVLTSSKVSNLHIQHIVSWFGPKRQHLVVVFGVVCRWCPLLWRQWIFLFSVGSQFCSVFDGLVWEGYQKSASEKKAPSTVNMLFARVVSWVALSSSVVIALWLHGGALVSIFTLLIELSTLFCVLLCWQFWCACNATLILA